MNIIRLLRKAADAILFSSFFLAFCAMLMVWQTSYLLRFPLQLSLLFFTAFGTLCSYNFHQYFTPFEKASSAAAVWSERHKTLHGILSVLSFIGAAATGIMLLQHWPLLLITGFATFLYSAPKLPYRWALLLQKIAIGKTIFLAAVWTHVTVVLPLLIAKVAWSVGVSLFVANRFLFLYAICILFDYRDREADRQQGIRSLLTWLSHKGIKRLFWASLIGFSITSFFSFINTFSPLHSIVLFLPGLIVAALWPVAIKHKSDYLYLFVLDGLMALSALLLWVIHFTKS